MTWRLVTLDLDGTLLPDDTAFAAVLRGNGQADAVAASDARYFAGKQDLEATFWEQWGLVKRLRLADCHRALRRADWLPGIAEGVQRLKAAGARVCLLTDQPSTLTDFLGRWGLTDAICSPVDVREGMPVDIEARFEKRTNLQARCGEWGIPLDAVCHVGNGENDVPVWQAVGGAVAVFAAPDVAAAARIDLGRVDGMDAIVDAVLDLEAA